MGTEGLSNKGRKGMKTTALPAVAVEGRVISDRDEAACPPHQCLTRGRIGQSMYLYEK